MLTKVILKISVLEIRFEIKTWYVFTGAFACNSMNVNKTCWQMQLLRNPENKSHTRGKYNGGNCSCQAHAHCEFDRFILRFTIH